MLAILTTHYNPINFERQKTNARCFYNQIPEQYRDHVFGLTADFGNGIESKYSVPASDTNIMWQKERMLNWLIETLPPKYDKVAWVDADLIFCNPYWYEQTEEELDKNLVCQMFSAVSDTNKDGEVVRRKHGVGWRWVNKREDTKNWYRPGGAWAAHRKIAETCISDEHITGGGDCTTAFAWTGEPTRWTRHIKYFPEWESNYLVWARKQEQMVNGKIGYVHGEVIHLWHGDKEDRQYGTRTSILEKFNFNPYTDIKIGEHGLWEWDSDRPEMHNGIKKYFVRRKEDG